MQAKKSLRVRSLQIRSEISGISSADARFW